MNSASLFLPTTTYVYVHCTQVFIECIRIILRICQPRIMSYILSACIWTLTHQIRTAADKLQQNEARATKSELNKL